MKRVFCLLLSLLAAPASVQALEGAAIGQEPAGFMLPSLDGRPVSLEYFEGGPGVIVFWSTWSPRSLEILADFRDYHESWAEKGLKVIAVNADRELLSESNRDEVARIAREMDLPFPVVFDVGLRTYAEYGVMALPSAVVVGADGRIAHALGGYPPTRREQFWGTVLESEGSEAAAAPLVAQETPLAPAETPGSVCVLPRARFCQLQAEANPAADDPGVLAVRLAVCRGDAEEAERMLHGVGRERLGRPDLRFALAGLMLLKERTAEAGRAFRSLQDRHPREAWGDWGLGLLALAEGDEQGALDHMRAAAEKGGASAEAETAVLQFLAGHWERRRRAPAEDGFLSIFRGLVAVRDCFQRQQQPG